MNNSITLKTELEKSASGLVIGQLFGRIDSELKRLNSAQEVDISWFVDLTNVLSFSGKAEVGFTLVQAVGLAIAERRWEDLPVNVRMPYGMEFMLYATATIDKDYSTIRNYINTANTWVLNGGITPNFTIEIPERNVDGRPIKEGERVKTKVVEWSPYEVPITKLLYANAVAKEGKLTPKLWSLLADKYVSCEEFRSEITTRPEGKDDFEDLKFVVIGPMLCVVQYGEAVEIAEITAWEKFYADEESLEKSAIKRLLGTLSIKLDEVTILERQHYVNAIQKADNGHQPE